MNPFITNVAEKKRETSNLSVSRFLNNTMDLFLLQVLNLLTNLKYIQRLIL
jgi:hypothetical protein